MKTIDLIGIESPRILIDGKLYLLIEDLCELIFADEVMVYDYIEEHEDEFEGHVVEYADSLAIDWDGLKKIDFVGQYEVFLDIVKEAVRSVYERKY